MNNAITRAVAHFFKNKLIGKYSRRKPDFVIGPNDNPYMERWWMIPRNRWFNVYLHRIWRDDDDRAMHDHPWMNVSVVLQQIYVENTPKGVFIRQPGDVIFRMPGALHRLELFKRLSSAAERNSNIDPESRENIPTWSLFITGPKVRTWGFQCSKGWIPWYNFVDANNKGAIGPGCGD